MYRQWGCFGFITKTGDNLKEKLGDKLEDKILFDHLKKKEVRNSFRERHGRAGVTSLQCILGWVKAGPKQTRSWDHLTRFLEEKCEWNLHKTCMEKNNKNKVIKNQKLIYRLLLSWILRTMYFYQIHLWIHSGNVLCAWAGQWKYQVGTQTFLSLINSETGGRHHYHYRVMGDKVEKRAGCPGVSQEHVGVREGHVYLP